MSARSTWVGERTTILFSCSHMMNWWMSVWYARMVAALRFFPVRELRKSVSACSKVRCVIGWLSPVCPYPTNRAGERQTKNPEKSGSDNIGIFPLYGTNKLLVYGENYSGWFRE